MYGRRRYSRRRRYRNYNRYKNTGYLGKAGKALSMAGTALAVARGVKNLLNVEYKNYTNETELNPYAITNVDGQSTYLLRIGQGDDESNRNGNSVKLTQFYLKGHMEWNSLSGRRQVVRLVLVQDKAQDGTNRPRWGDATNPENNVFTSLDVNSLKNLATTDRFKVLYDKKFFVNSENPTVEIDIFRKLNDKVEFNGTDAAIPTSAGYNSLWLMMLSDQYTGDYPNVYASWRCRYIDN